MSCAICYKVKTPHKYDNGEVCDHFMRYQTYKNLAEAQEECDELNRTKPATLWNGDEVDWNEVLYFYPYQQERIDTRDCTSYWPGGD